MRAQLGTERGFSLVEVLVTVSIVGIAFVVFVGGMGTAIMGADHHRKIAVGQASIRNFGEAIKAAPYVDCATTSSYAGAFSPTPPDRVTAGATATNATSHVAPSVDPAEGAKALLTFFALGTGSSFTQPTGMGEAWDIASTAPSSADRVTAAFDDQVWTSTNATGARTSTSGASGDSVAQTVGLAGTGTVVRRGVTTAAVTAPVVTPTSTTAPSTTTTTLPPTITLSKPAGTAAGDTMIAQVAVRGGSAASIAAPTGWIRVDVRNVGTSVKSAIYQRTAATSDANAYTWTLDAPRDAVAGIVSYGGIANSAFATSITALNYWNGTSFVASCPNPDNGLQRISLRIVSADGASVETVDVVKRKP